MLKSVMYLGAWYAYTDISVSLLYYANHWINREIGNITTDLTESLVQGASSETSDLLESLVHTTQWLV